MHLSKMDGLATVRAMPKIPVHLMARGKAGAQAPVTCSLTLNLPEELWVDEVVIKQGEKEVSVVKIDMEGDNEESVEGSCLAFSMA